MRQPGIEEKKEFLKHARADIVFFVENLLYTEEMEPYILEEHQKEFLRCTDSYRLLFWARRLSKSTNIRFDILHKSFFIPNLSSLTVLPTWNQAIKHGEEFKGLIRRSPLIGEVFDKKNVTSLSLLNGSRINSASAGNDAVGQLGQGARYLAFDEAQQISDNVYGFVLPIMRGTLGKKWQVFAGTPLSKSGIFWESYNDAKLYLNKGKVTKVEIDDTLGGEQFVVFERQTAYLDAEGNIIESGTNRLTIQELLSDRRRIDALTFNREYCLQWMDTIGEVFPQELIEACELREKNDTVKLTSTAECVMGVDIGKQRNNSVIAIGERQAHGKVKIIYYHTFDLKTPYKEVARFACNVLPARFPNLRKMVVDKTGVGDAVIELFQEGVKNKGIKVEGFNFAGQDKKRGLVEAAVLEMEQNKVKFVYNNYLRNEMLGYKRILNDKTGKITYSKPNGGSDDHLDAYMLCLAANRDTPSPITEFNVISAGAKIMEKFASSFINKDPRYSNVQYRNRRRY